MMSSRAHVSSRRRVYSQRCVSSPDLSSGSVFARPRVFADLSLGSGFARPCVFAMTRLFARPVFRKCLRPPMCLHDDAHLRQTCLRGVFSRSHVSSRGRVSSLSSPDLSSGRAFARPRVFATMRAFARPVFGTCLLVGRWLHSWKCPGKSSALGKCLQTPTCLRSQKCLRQEGVFKHPRVFAVFAWHVSADT